MRREIDRLRDILERTSECAQLVAEGREIFDARRERQYALVHIIVLAGEAATGLPPSFRAEHPAIAWTDPIRTRNRLIHGYWDIDLDTAWRIASESMPLLEAQVRALLRELEGGAASPDQPIAEEATAVYSSPTAEYYTPAQVADRLAVSPRMVYLWIEEGTLPAQRVSERVTHVSAQALEAFVAAATQPATDNELFRRPPLFI